MRQVVVFFLVREVEGLSRLARFLDARARHPARTDHRLIVLLKGFSSPASEWIDLLRADGCEWRFVPDGGFDIGTYWTAAASTEADYFCFLNSHSEPIVDGWLEILVKHASQPGVGIVGATGSYERPPLRMPPRFLGRIPGVPRLNKWLRQRNFPPFPEGNVRTTGFVLPRPVFRRVRTGRLRDKYDAWLFEAGPRGLSAQVKAMGLARLVAGSDGEAYPPERWPQSRTFRSGHQENLLIADNHTRGYETALADYRQELRTAAWGPQGGEPW